jgi:hypothetical protein
MGRTLTPPIRHRVVSAELRRAHHGQVRNRLRLLLLRGRPPAWGVLQCGPLPGEA